MPILDNYLLGNYKLDGPGNSNGGSTFIPNLSQTTAGIAPGTTGELVTFTTFPAGTRFISVNTLGGSSVVPYALSSPSLLVLSFALVDDKGEIFHIVDIPGNQYRSILYLNIDCIHKVAYSYSSNYAGETTADGIGNTPTGSRFVGQRVPSTQTFNFDGVLKLSLAVVQNSLSSVGNYTYKWTASRISSV